MVYKKLVKTLKFFDLTCKTSIVKIIPEEAAAELNERFKKHEVNYSFDGNKIITVDSTYIHSEITKPVVLWYKIRSLLKLRIASKTIGLSFWNNMATKYLINKN